MRARPDSLVRTTCVGGAGAVWGLGLARLMAEASFLAWFYLSPLAVAGTAGGCAAIAIAFWGWKRHPRGDVVALVPLAFPVIYVAGFVSSPLAGCALLAGGAILAALSACGERARWMAPTVLGLLAFALYLRTLLPAIGEADTFEFQVVVPLLQVAHPTGYPLYILLGKLFTLLPLGNVAWRVNLASAVFATGAALVLYALLLRLTGRWLPAFLAALAFACSSTFWSQAIVAEVYALHNLLAATLLWLLVGWPEASESPGMSPRGSACRWQATFFLVGLSLTNHLTTALLVPAVVLALVWECPRLRAKHWLVAGSLLLLGLSVYLFIPLRWPALNQGARMTTREFVDYIAGGQFHGALRVDAWRDPVRWSIVGRLLRDPFGWVGLGLAAVGVLSLAVYRRRALALTGVVFLAFFAYGLAYHVPDISVFLLPAQLVLAIWIAVGVASLADRIARRCHSLFAICHMSLVIPFALLPLSRIWLNLPVVDRSADQGGGEWGRYVLSLPLAANSAVMADVKKFAPLYYVQQIEGMRPDLDLLLLGSEDLYQAELAARVQAGQKVYLARYLPHLDGLHLRSEGPLVEVSTVPLVHLREPDVPLGVRFGHAVRLMGLDADRLAVVQGATLCLTLHWYAESSPGGDYFVRMRLIDAGGHVSWQNDGVRPVAGLYPTTAWGAGEVVSDFHEFLVPSYLPPGAYRLEVGLFPPFADRGLPAGGDGEEWATLATFEVGVSGALRPLSTSKRSLFGRSLWLTSYDMPVEVTVGAPVAVTLAWRGTQPVPDAELRLGWLDELGRVAVVTASVRSTDRGNAREFQSRHIISAPLVDGPHRLVVSWVDGAGVPVSARCGWLTPPTGYCSLGAVETVQARQGLANYADLVLLAEAALDGTSARRGGIIGVALRWRALRAMDEDYTVSVQLVGPDGRLHGQVDTWPVQGSHPTSHWTPGEELADVYEVQLDDDAPPGHYHVEVSWYLLATMQRLPLVNADGRPVADSVGVGGFDVRD